MAEIDEANLVICCFCGSVKIRVSLPGEKPRYKCLKCGAVTYYQEPVDTWSGRDCEITKFYILEEKVK